MFISHHFTLEEFTQSSVAKSAGIDNSAPPHVAANLIIVASELEVLRKRLSKPIKITSGYRSKILNTKVGGASNSAHTLGLAADIKVEGLTPYQLAIEVINSGINYDQVILEPSWVHVGFAEDKSKARKEVLTKVNSGYITGLKGK